MKTHIVPALRLTIVCLLVFVGAYSMLVWGFAQVASPSKGNAETIQLNGKIVGARLDGQAFTQDIYFQGRPSAVDYNGGGSCGSNKGPSNPDYLAQVQTRIDTFLVHNPTATKSAIPSDLVTASGSGLDPHISPEAAFVQVSRIANARTLDQTIVKGLVEKAVRQPLWGLFGTKTVNVLELNCALDQFSK